MEEKYISFIISVLYPVLKAVVPNIIAKISHQCGLSGVIKGYSIHLEHFYAKTSPYKHTRKDFWGIIIFCIF